MLNGMKNVAPALAMHAALAMLIALAKRTALAMHAALAMLIALAKRTALAMLSEERNYLHFHSYCCAQVTNALSRNLAYSSVVTISHC